MQEESTRREERRSIFTQSNSSPAKPRVDKSANYEFLIKDARMTIKKVTL